MLLYKSFLFALSCSAALAAGEEYHETANTSTLVPRAAEKLGFDVSVAQSTSFFSCMRKNGYTKAVIRAYIQGCGVGGEVDSGFMTSYNNARAAGFKAPNDIDAYMFPCTGTQSSRSCKPIQTQINELLNMFKSKKVEVHRIWLDVEPTRTPRDACNAWNLGQSRNFDLAKQWTAAMRKTGLKWGIYGNPNQWTGMFPAKASNIGSDLPLWVVVDDRKQGVGTVSQGQLMGGWSTSRLIGKQFLLGTSVCGGGLDKDSFKD